MADKLKFDLVSPEALLMSEDVNEVTIPGAEGEMGILANHAPVMTTLRPGIIEVKTGSEDVRVFVWGGFAEVNAQGLTVLAEEAVHLNDLDVEALAKRINELEQDVADFDDPERKEAAEQKLWHVRHAYEFAKAG